MNKAGLLLAMLSAAALTGADERPQFSAKGELMRPADYRQWVYLSSGLGMTYGPAAAMQMEPTFDNVFVSPPAYKAFLETGRWPDNTILVLEVRASQSKGSINQGGHFQGAVVGMEAEVKQGGKWSFYGFAPGAAAGKRQPDTADCYSCHARHGAVDNTFVQFYPTLLDVAKAKKTFIERER